LNDAKPKPVPEPPVAGLDQRFQMLVEGLPLGLLLVDASGRIEYTNPRSIKYLGRPIEGTLDGRDAESVLHPEDGERVISAWLAARSGERPFEVEGRLRRHDGTYRWHLGRGFPIREKGVVTHWVICGTDVDKVKRALETLRQAEKEKDSFLAMLGHELRNPLGPIQNASQILSMVSSLEPTGAHALQIIDRQVGLMARLVDDLLDVSRIVAGRLEVRRERVDFAEIVRQAVESYRAQLDAAGLGLVTDLAAGPFVVTGDRGRLVQIVGNLLHNARKFTPPGGSVTVRLGMRAGDGAAFLTVTDTGIGMDPEVLQRAFDVFSQADRSLERAGGGLGLGLALVKGLVDLHGGEVRATSAGPRKGTQVTLALPIERGEAPSEAAGVAGASVAARVLVIEDNYDAAESLQTLLRLAGHDVQLALSGTSGLAVAERFQPEVVLCDIGLPGMDGYAVARALRQSAATSGALLVALTGYGQDEDRRRGAEAGFDEYLTKPADFRTLQRVLHRRATRP
jgi:PAS domain S-box-containing protein